MSNIENNFEIDINDGNLGFIAGEEACDYYINLRDKALEDKGHYTVELVLKTVVAKPKEVIEHLLQTKELIPSSEEPKPVYYEKQIINYETPCYITSDDFRKDYYEDFLYWKINSLDWRDVYDFLDHHYNKDGEKFYTVLELCAGSKGCFVSESKHCDSINKWLENNKEIQIAYTKKNKLLKSIDNRIKGNLPKENIEKYFMSEFTKEKKGEKILSETDIRHFLHANFVGFNPIEKIKPLNPNWDQAKLKRCIYKFYKDHRNSTHEAQRYCELLLNNFPKLFFISKDGETDGYKDIKSLVSNFSG